MSELHLTPRQRQRLREQLLATRDAAVYRRTLAILEIDAGRPVTEVAEILRAGRRSVYHWLAAYRAAYDPRALVDQPGRGRPRAGAEDLLALLRQAMGQPPEAWGYQAVDWTVPLLREFLAEQGGERLSEDTVRRRLHELGYVWKRSRYALPPDPR
jgi:transposase